MALITLVLIIELFILSMVRLLIPVKTWRNKLNHTIHYLPETWAKCVFCFLDSFLHIQWEVEGFK